MSDQTPKGTGQGQQGQQGQGGTGGDSTPKEGSTSGK